MQGYLFSRPLPAEGMADALARTYAMPRPSALAAMER
jgi:EAL domain-containing protein (putative c-di-GMP-specific phosphodiesterase class I)